MSLLATSFVVGAGAFACLFIGLASGDENPLRPLATAGACFGAIIVLLWLLRDRNDENRVALRWGWLGRRRRKVEYRLSTRPRSAQSPPRPIAPPTAATVRELSGGIHTWVPSQAAPRRGKPGSESNRRSGR